MEHFRAGAHVVECTEQGLFAYTRSHVVDRAGAEDLRIFDEPHEGATPLVLLSSSRVGLGWLGESGWVSESDRHVHEFVAITTDSAQRVSTATVPRQKLTHLRYFVRRESIKCRLNGAGIPLLAPVGRDLWRPLADGLTHALLEEAKC